MSHPFNQHRAHKVEHSRVGMITRDCGGEVSTAKPMGPTGRERIGADGKVSGYKKGGAVMRAAGGQVKARADRPNRAWGGRLGKKKSGGKKAKGGNHVNVIIAPHPKAALPMMPPGGAPPMPPQMPPKPPMMPPPAGPGPTGAPPGVSAGPLPPPGALPPPGMPPRYAGGRAYKKGGAVFSGEQMKTSMTAKGSKGSMKADADSAGIGQGRTPVQPSPNKQDGKNIGRKPVITKATGGPISSRAKGEMGPKPPGGSAGGEFREWYTARYEKKGYGNETRNAQNPTRNP